MKILCSNMATYQMPVDTCHFPELTSDDLRGQMFILKPNEVAHTYPSYWGMEQRIT